MMSSIVRLLQAFMGPKYDGIELKSKVEKLLGDTTLEETLTNVVIPTFDIKHLQPVIFPTKDAKANPLKNARLADVCIGSSAVPTFLPPYSFETRDKNRETRRFDLIDGGVAANNPISAKMRTMIQTLVAPSHINKEIPLQNDEFKDINLRETDQILVLSLGTGSAKHKGKYSAAEAARWELINWNYNKCFTPLVDIFNDGISDMDDTLTRNQLSLDNATRKNLNELVKIGENLLQKRVSRVNLETGKLEEIDGECTNKDALKCFANRLSKERSRRVEEKKRQNK